MAEKTLIAKIRREEDHPEMLLVASPVVGMADGAPRQGIFLNPLDRVISMKILNERYVLRLPRDAHGWITEVLIPNAYVPVAYGQPLARLDPRALASGAQEQAETAAAGGGAGAGEDAGLLTVEAPSEGIFYRRPSPDAPPYVEVGATVARGTVLGLVEVMKCFNAIAYGGPALPERGEVAAILAEDAAEVSFGQPLFRIRPLE